MPRGCDTRSVSRRAEGSRAASSVAAHGRRCRVDRSRRLFRDASRRAAALSAHRPGREVSGQSRARQPQERVREESSISSGESEPGSDSRQSRVCAGNEQTNAEAAEGTERTQRTALGAELEAPAHRSSPSRAVRTPAWAYEARAFSASSVVLPRPPRQSVRARAPRGLSSPRQPCVDIWSCDPCGSSGPSVPTRALPVRRPVCRRRLEPRERPAPRGR
jgi:hypothetical protein